VDQYHFTVLQPTDPRPDAPEKFVSAQAHEKAQLDYFGIGFESYDQLIDTGVGTVIEAPFERASVVETLADSGYEQTGEYQGYTLFARSDVPRRAAVGDSVVAWTSAYHHKRPNIEALIDAENGDRPRYHEENQAFSRLVTAAGSNPYLGVNTAIHDPTGRPAMVADAFRFDDDTAYQVIHYHYEENRIPTGQALESALKKDSYRFADEAETFDVQIDGQLATIETRVPLRPERDFDPEYQLPQVTWGVTRDEESEKVTFRHEAGESVPADRLYYDVDYPSAPGKIEKRPLWTDVDSVTAGTEATVDLREHPNATDVTLVYSTGGLQFHVLFGLDHRGESGD
jgi:hypothetical protein